MKKLLIFFALMLTSCVNLAFDPIEYDNFISIKQHIDKTIQHCTDYNIVKLDIDILSHKIEHQTIYSINRQGREQIMDATKTLHEMVKQLSARYNTQDIPSQFYCMEKLANISIGTDILIKELGKL